MCWLPEAAVNKLPHIGGLTQRYLFSHLLEARGLKSRWWQCTPAEVLRGRPSPASSSFWWHQVSLACGGITPISVFVFISSSALCLLRTLVIRFRAHPSPRRILPQSPLLYLWRLFFQSKFRFTGSRRMDLGQEGEHGPVSPLHIAEVPHIRSLNVWNWQAGPECTELSLGLRGLSSKNYWGRSEC